MLTPSIFNVQIRHHHSASGPDGLVEMIIFSTVILLIRSVLHAPNVLTVQFYQDFGQSLCLVHSIGTSFFQVKKLRSESEIHGLS